MIGQLTRADSATILAPTLSVSIIIHIPRGDIMSSIMNRDICTYLSEQNKQPFQNMIHDPLSAPTIIDGCTTSSWLVCPINPNLLDSTDTILHQSHSSYFLFWLYCIYCILLTAKQI